MLKPKKLPICFGSFLCLVVLQFLTQPVWACQCEFALSPCNEASISNLVFIGTAESIRPIFLNRWNFSSLPSLQVVNHAYLQAQEHPSADALVQLKEAYLKAFPDLEGKQKSQIEGAKTVADVVSLFYSSLYRGMQIRFRVATIFKHGDDGDEDGDDEEIKYFEVGTPFGDCGYDFQVGETYLVYANNDEDSKPITTTTCTRTKRLSDVGEDLSYLFFLKNQPKESARLEGFTTTALNQLDFHQLEHLQSVKDPAPGLIVELRSPHGKRYAQSDTEGRFVFDGLPEGEYQLSAFGSDYPQEQKRLAGPQSFHIEQKSCAHQVLLLPKEKNK